MTQKAPKYHSKYKHDLLAPEDQKNHLMFFLLIF